MARQNHGPLSRAKGKLGGVVYQQYEGMQISREYQPVVKNPQTSKQVENRAKFKLSSQIVAQFKDVFNLRLAKLSNYTRMRRAAAVNAIYTVATAGTADEPATLVNSVVYAINNKSLSAIAAPTITPFSNGSVNITAESGKTVTYTMVSYDENGTPMKIESDTYTSAGTPKQVTAETGANTAVVMAVSTEATTEDGRAIINNTSIEDNKFYIEISRGVAAGDLEVSAMSAQLMTP